MQHQSDSRSGLARWLRHLATDVSDARRLLPEAACQRLETCVRSSEARHLGELRVCVEASLTPYQLWCGVTARQRAVELFSQLRVWDTEHNNGVLIYLLLSDRRIEVLADRGLMHKLDGSDHWEQLVASLSDHLGRHQMEQGLQHAIEQIGALLQRHYPVLKGQRNANELPDGIVLI
ncbi:MAG TPA: TPM domain-containing protein [Aquabacterium sp.]|nr:TPM domain-containing protein [Aquabacterium sp.]